MDWDRVGRNLGKRSILAYKPGGGDLDSVLGAFFFFFLGLFTSFFLSTNLTISQHAFQSDPSSGGGLVRRSGPRAQT